MDTFLLNAISGGNQFPQKVNKKTTMGTQKDRANKKTEGFWTAWKGGFFSSFLNLEPTKSWNSYLTPSTVLPFLREKWLAGF